MREKTDFEEILEKYKQEEVIITKWDKEGDISHLRCIIKATEETPYKGGFFTFELIIPNNYPFHPPTVYCRTKIWHPNIDHFISLVLINPSLIGYMSASTGQPGWTPSKRLVDVIDQLKAMIEMKKPYFNPSMTLNSEAGNQYYKNKEEFNNKVIEWVKKYAQKDSNPSYRSVI